MNRNCNILPLRYLCYWYRLILILNHQKIHDIGDCVGLFFKIIYAFI